MEKSKEKNAFGMVLVIIIRVGVQLMTFDVVLVIIIRVGVQLMRKIYICQIYFLQKLFEKIMRNRFCVCR